MPPIAEPDRLDDPTFVREPFTLDDARRAGISRGRIRAAVESGRLIAVKHSVYVDAVAWASLGEGEALRKRVSAWLCELHEDAAISHETAAFLHPLPTPRANVDWSVEPIHATLSGSTGWRSPGLVVHGRLLPSSAVTRLDGLPITTIPRTAIDLARRQSLSRALIPLDAAMRRLIAEDVGERRLRSAVHDVRFVEPARQRLFEELANTGWVQGRRGLLIAIAAADPASESPSESQSRGHIRQARLCPPICGYPVVVDGVTRYLDLAWPELKVAAEVDGLLKYTNPSDLIREKAREDGLRREGWTIIRWTGSEAADPAIVVSRVRRALTEAAAR